MDPVASLPEKVGAGLLFMCNGEILLLRRSATSGNPRTLGLPGGNADPEDQDLLATAVREAGEEMGEPIPAFTNLGACFIKRGKRLQKEYTVFLVAMDPEVKKSWKPILNEEHTEYAWIPLPAALAKNDLHPVVAKVLREEPHRQVVLKALSECGPLAPAQPTCTLL